MRRSGEDNKMVEYMVIEESILTQIIKAVNDFAEKGWEPLGGITVVVDRFHNKRFYQAMIKQAKKEDT